LNFQIFNLKSELCFKHLSPLIRRFNYNAARIFCHRLEAELMAVNGFYLTAEDMEPDLRGRAVQAWLESQTLKTTILG
jgi:septum formation inhibitor MinC